MIDMPPIPDFLIATPENTRQARAAWKPCRHRTAKSRRRPFHVPPGIEPVGLAMLKEIERQKKAKKKAKKKARKR